MAETKHCADCDCSRAQHRFAQHRLFCARGCESYAPVSTAEYALIVIDNGHLVRHEHFDDARELLKSLAEQLAISYGEVSTLAVIEVLLSSTEVVGSPLPQDQAVAVVKAKELADLYAHLGVAVYVQTSYDPDWSTLYRSADAPTSDRVDRPHAHHPKDTA